MKWVIWTVAPMLAAQLAWADLIYFRDGTVREGKVVSQTEEKVEVAFVTPTGTLRVIYPLDKITRIEVKKTPNELVQEEYQQRATALKPDDVAGWVKLGEWCSRQPMLQTEAKGAYQQALSIDANNEAARKALGYVNYRGVWMTQDEAMGAQGYVHHQGKWIPREEYLKLLEAEAARSAIVTARERELLKQLAEAEARAADAEAKLREAQDKLSNLTRRVDRLENVEPKTVIIRERERYPLWWWATPHHPPVPRAPDPAPKDPAPRPEPKLPTPPGGPIGKKLTPDTAEVDPGN